MALLRQFSNQTPVYSHFFNDMLNDDFFQNSMRRNHKSLPAVNISEDNQQFLIEVAAPGLNKENFNVRIDNNVLAISYKQEENKEETEKGFSRREFSYSTFNRSFSIPKDEVDDSSINAAYSDGILKVSIKKREIQTESPREIAIN